MYKRSSRQGEAKTMRWDDRKKYSIKFCPSWTKIKSWWIDLFSCFSADKVTILSLEATTKITLVVFSEPKLSIKATFDAMKMKGLPKFNLNLYLVLWYYHKLYMSMHIPWSTCRSGRPDCCRHTSPSTYLDCRASWILHYDLMMCETAVIQIVPLQIWRSLLHRSPALETLSLSGDLLQ